MIIHAGQKCLTDPQPQKVELLGLVTQTPSSSTCTNRTTAQAAAQLKATTAEQRTWLGMEQTPLQRAGHVPHRDTLKVSVSSSGPQQKLEPFYLFDWLIQNQNMMQLSTVSGKEQSKTFQITTLADS